MAEVALDRDALYYPYIHIPDVNWLKATLLCFPRVKRIVPSNFLPEDSEEVREFTQLQGFRGPLLSQANLFSGTVTQAQRELAQKIESQSDLIVQKYSKIRTEQELGPKAGSFWIHSNKILPELADCLRTKGLAWEATGTWLKEPYMWLSVHPKLGGAVMGTLAVAIAKSEGLDIVTPSDASHYVLVRSTDEDAFAGLLGDVIPSAPRRDDLVDQLSEVVMTTTFDFSRLTPQNIADLIKDGNDLRDFKNALLPIVATIPDIADEAERKQRLEAAAEEVRKQWSKYRRSLPRFAIDALVEAGDFKFPEIASSFITGATTFPLLGTGVGIGVALTVYGVAKVIRKYRENTKSPYRFLSRIHKVGATLNVPLSAPRKP